MQIKVCLPRGHFFALHVRPLAAWGRGQSAEGPALVLLFIFLPHCRGGVGRGWAREVHIPFLLLSLPGAASEGKASSKMAPTGSGWGTGLWKGEVGTVAKQQAEEFISAPPHLSTLSPGSLPPAPGPPDHRGGHSLSPHARRVSQASPPPLEGPPEAPFCPPCTWLPRLCQGWVT